MSLRRKPYNGAYHHRPWVLAVPDDDPATGIVHLALLTFCYLLLLIAVGTIATRVVCGEWTEYACREKGHLK